NCWSATAPDRCAPANRHIASDCPSRRPSCAAWPIQTTFTRHRMPSNTICDGLLAREHWELPLMTKALAVALGALLTAAPALAQDQVVNVYNWSDYIAEDTIEKFTTETGITVNYDVFDSNELVESKLLAGNSGYDVVVPSGFFLERQIQAGLFQPLDKSKLPNLEHMDPEVMESTASHDPGNEHAVDYMWGTTGLGYNVAAVTERLGADANLDSWDLLFDPETVAKLADCG